MKGRKLSFPAADGHHGIGIQRTFHAAVQHGAARFAGGGKVGARHAAAQRHHAGTNDLQRAVHAQLNGFAAVGLTAAQSQVGPSVRMGLCTVHSSRTLCTGSRTTVRTVRPCHTASKR